MNYLFNNPQFKILRKNLRRDQTNVERLLWSYLRNKQLRDIKFYRQYGVGPYILDFYAPSLHLGIELDGGQHNTKDGEMLDTNRTDYLQKYGIRILRFWDNDGLTNIKGVLEAIIFS